MPKDIDHGWNALARDVQKLARKGAFVRVGVQGSAAKARHVGGDDDDGGRERLTVVEVAARNEFGAGVPERSFLRSGIDQHEKTLQKTALMCGRAVLLNKASPEQALSLLGMQAQGLLVERINNGIAPPNAPSTVERKGSSTPLVDKGQLKDSITFQVERAA